MVMNILEILVTMPSALSNIVLGTQVVMLDVGGFSLASMGEQARQQGDERAARKASVTGNFLIGVTIVTLLLVTIGLLWSAAKQDTDMAEKGLILVRVIMTVIYGHVIHSLRSVTTHRQHASPKANGASPHTIPNRWSEQQANFPYVSPNIRHLPKRRMFTT